MDLSEDVSQHADDHAKGRQKCGEQAGWRILHRPAGLVSCLAVLSGRGAPAEGRHLPHIR
jgi:hypothetical protein